MPKEMTAIMQLIQYAQECADFITDDDSKEDKYARLAYKDIVAKATSLLPVGATDTEGSQPS